MTVDALSASAGASRRATALLGLGAIRSLFQLMGRSVGSWYRRGRGVLVGEGRVALGRPSS